MQLSHTQMGVVVECLAHPDSTRYNLAYDTQFPLSVSKEALCVALQRIIAVRRALKIQFSLDAKGTPMQYVDERLEIPVTQIDLREEELSAFLQGSFSQPFSLLEKGPLVRIVVASTECARHLLVSWSHAVTDATTFLHHFLQRDLTAALSGKALLPEEALIAGNVGESCDASRDAYKERFEGASPVFIADFVGNQFAPLGYGTHTLSQPLVDEFCKRQGVSPSRFLSAVYAIVLSRWSREENLFFNQMRHGRTPHNQEAYGMYVRTAPVLVHLSGHVTISQLFQELHDEAVFHHQHSDYPYIQFHHEVLGAETTEPTIFNFYGSALPLSLTMEGNTYPIRVIHPVNTNESLACTVYLRQAEYELCVTGALSRYEQTTLKAFAKSLSVVAHYIMAHPNATIAQIPLLDEEDIKSMLQFGQGETVSFEENDTFLDLFARQVQQTPQHIAVVAEDGSYTYAQLSERADTLASMLKRGSTRFVAILLPRTRDFLAAAIAVEKAGCTYVPIDDEYPAERIDYILKDCGAEMLITTHELYADCGLSSNSLVRPLFVNETMADVAHEATDKRFVRIQPQDAAYMIYTSGSTGKPKGVVISHRAKSHFVQFIAREWRLTAESRILCHSSFAFDASVEDLFPVLTVGGCVHLAPDAIRRDLHGLHQYIVGNHITGGCMTTQLGQMLLQTYPDLPMDYLVLGGERMTENPTCKLRLINTYGPTEFTVDATYYELQHGRAYNSIPIGRPLYNQTALVCGAYGHLMPKGAPGELYLMGNQMASGYWQRPEQTAKVFVAPSFTTSGTEALCYRTGDLVRWNEEGQLEYIGRTDHQVKLHGFRIEMGEIEAVLQQHPLVDYAVVQLFEGRHLAAYIKKSAPINARELCNWLQLQLPAFMVPTHWASISNIPLTINGKLNTKALPAPLPLAPKDADTEPTNTIEACLQHVLMSIMQESLEYDDVGVETDLTELGLSSIDIMRFCIEVHRFIPITYNDIVTKRTIRQLSKGMLLPMTHWFTDNDPSKPLLIVHAGLGNILPYCQEFLNSFGDEFSIFGYECILDQFFKHNVDELTLNDITEWLMSNMPEINPKRKVLMTGFCLGSELAIVMAQEYARRFPERPRPYVINYDGEYHRATPFDKHAYDAYHLSHAMLQKVLLMDKVCSLMPAMQYDGPILHAMSTLPPEPAPAIVDPKQEEYDDSYIQYKLAGWRSAYPEDSILCYEETHIQFAQNKALLEEIRKQARLRIGI